MATTTMCYSRWRRVLVAHPGQLRLILRSKNKNDRNDAEQLAKLLYLAETPTVHVPSLEVRTWRELINCRSLVIAKRTRAKNTLRALLRSAGVNPPKHPVLWTKAGLRRDLFLEEIETLVGQVRRIEQQLNRQARRTSAGAQLRTIPGVGARTAEAVAAFIDDPHRFPNAKADGVGSANWNCPRSPSIGRYFGLVPCQDQSGGRNRPNAISRLRYHQMHTPQIVERIRKSAPVGADTTSWRY